MSLKIVSFYIFIIVILEKFAFKRHGNSRRASPGNTDTVKTEKQIFRSATYVTTFPYSFWIINPHHFLGEYLELPWGHKFLSKPIHTDLNVLDDDPTVFSSFTFICFFSRSAWTSENAQKSTISPWGQISRRHRQPKTISTTWTWVADETRRFLVKVSSSFRRWSTCRPS